MYFRFTSSLTPSVVSAEEVTALRRQERKDFKIARAKAAVATVEAAERALLSTLPNNSTDPNTPLELPTPEEIVRPTRPTNTRYGNERELLEEELARQEEVEKATANLEHLQLIPQEVWFLAWGLGCLKVLDPANVSKQNKRI